MGFLDNSGDIILDAVLTDLGRKRLSEGNGNFNITKFALADDEINYKLYRNSNHPDGAHPSGSAFYDLEIVQTPVLESFTNNGSSMKSTLISLDNNDILYLPVLLLNTNASLASGIHPTENLHLVAVDQTTQGNESTSIDTSAIGRDNTSGDLKQGVLYGADPNVGGHIRIDQGVNNDAYTISIGDLIEENYIISIDGRLGTIVDEAGNSLTSTVNNASQTMDDDNIIFYTIGKGTDSTVVQNSVTAESVIAGAKGTTVKFKIQSSSQLRDSNILFQRLGFTKSIDGNSNTQCIDTIIRVVGVKYGNAVDIPVRFVKHI